MTSRWSEGERARKSANEKRKSEKNRTRRRRRRRDEREIKIKITFCVLGCRMCAMRGKMFASIFSYTNSCKFSQQDRTEPSFIFLLKHFASLLKSFFIYFSLLILVTCAMRAYESIERCEASSLTLTHSQCELMCQNHFVYVNEACHWFTTSDFGQVRLENYVRILRTVLLTGIPMLGNVCNTISRTLKHFMCVCVHCKWNSQLSKSSERKMVVARRYSITFRMVA